MSFDYSRHLAFRDAEHRFAMEDGSKRLLHAIEAARASGHARPPALPERVA